MKSRLRETRGDDGETLGRRGETLGRRGETLGRRGETIFFRGLSPLFGLGRRWGDAGRRWGDDLFWVGCLPFLAVFDRKNHRGDGGDDVFTISFTLNGKGDIYI